MTLTIELTPAEEAQLQQQASGRGLTVSEYMHHLLMAQLGTSSSNGAAQPERKLPFAATATPEEWIRAFNQWADSHQDIQANIPDEALRRENIYDDRGL
ncbi:MAG: hypothetical protein M3347_15125 [Armatimonadota bacterium]|nr:hypothetical protein [Armatimonadota bacterium]